MYNYSTPARVRLEAGFTGNINISEPTVETYQNQATGIINGIISRRYSLGAMLSDPDFSTTDAGKLLARVEELLGAGHLLNKDYDIQDQEGNSNGDKKIDDAYRILNDITAGNILLTNTRYEGTPPNETIVAGTGNEYPTLGSSPAGQPIAYPVDANDRIFTKNQQR